MVSGDAQSGIYLAACIGGTVVSNLCFPWTPKLVSQLLLLLLLRFARHWWLININKAAKNNNLASIIIHYIKHIIDIWYDSQGSAGNQSLFCAAFADERVLDVHWRMAKDPSSHMCLVQHKICVGGRERRRKVYLLSWREEVTAVSRENTLLMMETLKSIVSLGEE